MLSPDDVLTTDDFTIQLLPELLLWDHQTGQPSEVLMAIAKVHVL